MSGLSDVDKDRIISANLNLDVASTSYDANQKRWVDSYFLVGALSSNDWDASTAVYTDYQSIRSVASFVLSVSSLPFVH